MSWMFLVSLFSIFSRRLSSFLVWLIRSCKEDMFFNSFSKLLETVFYESSIKRNIIRYICQFHNQFIPCFYLEYYLNSMNWCCLPQKNNPNQTLYISPSYQLPTQSQKQKFSFRTAVSRRYDTSQVSQTSNYSQQMRQLQDLQREYEILKEDQKILDDFQKYRIGDLQNEVEYYERQLVCRAREINELNELFRVKINERRWLVQQGYTLSTNKYRVTAIDEISNSTQP